MNTIEFNQRASAFLEKNRNVENIFDPKGVFHVEHWRNNRKINEFGSLNGVTNEGKNFILDVMFHGTTAAPIWWLSLIDNSGYSALASTDTYDEINGTNGWDEFSLYGTGDRIEWVEDAASSQSIVNGGTVATFSITGSGTVKGAFLVGLGANADTVGDHAADGILWATTLFTAGDVVVANTDQLKVTYTVNA